MKIIPSFGMALIVEDKRDFAGSSIDIPDHMKTGLGTQGVIFAVTNDPEHKDQYTEGQHVVFSRLNEQISYYENGKETLYYAVPIQSIYGILIDTL